MGRGSYGPGVHGQRKLWSWGARAEEGRDQDSEPGQIDGQTPARLACALRGLDLGFSHTHCTVSLTGEPGPGMTIAIHLIKETPSTSARGSLARLFLCHVPVCAMVAQRDLAEEKEMLGSR